MPVLTWGAVGERFYESGIDRGVLYVGANAGVVWNGLISISESPTGGEAQPYYVDGFKYLNISAKEEFEATLQAFSAPLEFGVCDGMASISNGLYVTQQSRKPFGLAYRTKLGNDTIGVNYGYKIHIVYGALSSPSGHDYSTVSESTDPLTFSWHIATLPQEVTGYRPTSHFIIDSSKSTVAKMSTLEDILYGSASSTARLPTISELLTIFA